MSGIMCSTFEKLSKVFFFLLKLSNTGSTETEIIVMFFTVPTQMRGQPIYSAGEIKSQRATDSELQHRCPPSWLEMSPSIILQCFMFDHRAVWTKVAVRLLIAAHVGEKG